MTTGSTAPFSPKSLFDVLIKKKRIGHAYLFEGPAGAGKKELALWISRAILCKKPSEEGKPCESCTNCSRIKSGHHPDVAEISPEGQSIKVDQIRNLKSEFTKSGVESAKKVFIIEDAEKMTASAANSLLKFLEEPDGKVTAFLLTAAKNRLLPTILSRCQIVHFHPSALETRKQELIEEGIPETRAAFLVHLTGDQKKAIAWSEEEWYQDMVSSLWRWVTFIEKKDFQAFVFVQTDLMPILKEKERQEIFLDSLLLVYREFLHTHYFGESSGMLLNREKEIERLSRGKNGVGLTAVLSDILEAKKKLESNVAMQGLLEKFALDQIEKNV